MTNIIHGTLDFDIDNEFLELDYQREVFNNPDDLSDWHNNHYNWVTNFTGFLCDMRKPQPSWNDKIIKYFENTFNWQDIGTSYYRMDSGVILPTHKDTYKKYVDIFNLHGNEHTIYRGIVFLQDWQTGHYAEYDNKILSSWKAGNFVVWNNDTSHMAANIGVTPRYTLQVTGHVTQL